MVFYYQKRPDQQNPQADKPAGSESFYAVLISQPLKGAALLPAEMHYAFFTSRDSPVISLG